MKTRTSAAAIFTAALIGLTLFAALPASGSVGTFRPTPSNMSASQLCHRPFNAYAVPISFLSRCGDRIFRLKRVERLTGGGSEYIYNVAGVRTVITVAPKSFNPLKASARQLAKYHYPPKPSGGQALRTWISLVGKGHFVKPSSYLVGIYPSRTVLRAPNVYNPTWAGNMATQCTNCAAYQNVYATWDEPHYDSTPCSNPVADGNWVGLGGWNTTTLAQDGTAVGVENAGIGNHQAWYELIVNNSGPAVPIKGLYATDGQQFTAETDRIQGGYDFFLKNDYTGAKWSAFVSFSPYDGSTAEMITEDPNNGVGNGWRLEEFDPFTVVDAEATRDGTTYRGIANFDHDDMIMRYNSDTLAHAGSANSAGNSWTDNWDNCK